MKNLKVWIKNSSEDQKSYHVWESLLGSYVAWFLTWKFRISKQLKLQQISVKKLLRLYRYWQVIQQEPGPGIFSGNYGHTLGTSDVHPPNSIPAYLSPGQNVGLAEGRWAVCQKCIMIQKNPLVLRVRVFNRSWQMTKFTGYFTWTRGLLFFGNYPSFYK